MRRRQNTSLGMTLPGLPGAHLESAVTFEAELPERISWLPASPLLALEEDGDDSLARAIPTFECRFCRVARISLTSASGGETAEDLPNIE